MAVNIEIRYKENSQIKLNVPQIAELSNLSYGISDSNYTLERNKAGQYTILYDAKCIGRGFELSFEENGLYLRLPLPTAGYEIEVFYELAKKLCQVLEVDYFIRDEGIVPLEHVFDYIDPDKEASLNAIKGIDKKVRNHEMENMVIFGALNPIFLGIEEMNEINCSLTGLEKLLNLLQQKDVFYANPRFYQRNDGTIFGVYFVGENIVTVVPTSPKSPFVNIENVDSYYVRIPDRNDIPYEDFITHVDKLENYDNGHIIVSLNEDKIYELSSNYTVNMTTKERIKGVYFGTTLDDGRNHLNKIRKLELNIEELAAFNHLAVFLRWMCEHNMLSERLLKDVPNIKELIEDKNTDLRKVIVQEPSFGCTLKANHFNEIGKKFAKEFYVFGNGGYPVCVDNYALSVLGDKKYNSTEYKNEAYLFVPYNEEYYQGLSKYINDAWIKHNKLGR